MIQEQLNGQTGAVAVNESDEAEQANGLDIVKMLEVESVH